MYLSISRRGKVKEVLRNWPQKDVRFICVTDGGRILGLGDIGANGAGIPIGKLQLYTACAGVPPQYLLPMYLDAGTNNEQYLQDPLYLGMRKTRPSTDELYSFVDEFIEAVQEVFPKCCIHFEDWTGVDAVNLLQRYRDKYCVYNDDIQGTAGTTVAGMINASKIKGVELKDEKYLFLGAGSAALGLADLLCSALVGQGMELKDAQSRIYMFNRHGLLESTRKDLSGFQKPYAHQHAPIRDFVVAIESIKPTTIIGISTIGGAFTRQVIETMSRINDRPVILALSNPTDHAECTAEQAYTWSKGKAIYAAGVQFAPVHYNGQTFLPGQANNFYVFPAVGMAIFATQAKRVTDEMFIEAGQAVADQVAPELLKQGLLYPLQSNILETEIQTAARVAKLVFDWASPASSDPPTWSRSFAASFTSRNTPERRRRQRKRPDRTPRRNPMSDKSVPLAGRRFADVLWSEHQLGEIGAWTLLSCQLERAGHGSIRAQIWPSAVASRAIFPLLCEVVLRWLLTPKY